MGNEKADALAKEALNKSIDDSKNIFHEDLYKTINQLAKEETIKYIKEHDGAIKKGVKYVQNSRDFNIIPWFQKSTLDRKRMTMLNRIRSSHVRTKDHSYRKKILDKNKCECGEENIQTIEHLI